MSSKPADSAVLILDGFQQMKVELESSKYSVITMKMLQLAGNIQKKRLVSFTKDLNQGLTAKSSFAGETYSSLLENDFVPAQRFPETGFAINIDKASYSNIRRFVKMGSVIPPDAVRIEEMMNYFNFGYIDPPGDSVFAFDSHLTSCPWSPGNQLLFLKVCAKKIDPELLPPGNLVFLIDISGSMDMPNRLPLLKSAFTLMVNNLRDKDTVSIVVYGSTVGVWLPPTSGSEKMKIRQAIEDLNPGGATSGSSGIHTAYTLAKNTFIRDGNNRVILATDGDFNVGQTSEDELEKLISQNRQSGIYLTCLGVGMGNYKDSKLEVLAKKGNGNFAYLDNEKEAEKVLVKELTQTLYTVADDAFLNVQFNPAYVKNYRLIGFDNKMNAIADSSSELEGGEVGPGHTLMALFEIIPAKPDGPEALKSTEGSKTMTAVKTTKDWQAPESNKTGSFAKLTLNYKEPSGNIRKKSVFNCPANLTPFDEMPGCHRFAASVAMYGSLLKGSKFINNAGWNDVLELAKESCSKEDALQKEFIEIVQKTKKIYSKMKKRKK